MLKKIIFFSVIVFITYNGFSQTVKSFDAELDRYPDVVAAMFPANLSLDDQALIQKFKIAWDDNIFSSREKLEIIRISNSFLEKRARNIHYWLFWRCLLSFKEAENLNKGFDEWTKAMVAACQDRRSSPTSLQTLMNATLDLLNKRLICSSAAYNWRTSNHDYRYDFRDEQLSVIVGNSDITCFNARGDSIMIEKTAGILSVSDQMWSGNGGIVTWERAGFAPGEVTARLSKYTINMKRSEYEADSALLTHKTYFPTPVMGKLIDKMRHNATPEAALYPEFVTYSKTFTFKNLYPDVDYEGGISIQGARTIGSGTDEENAKITIQKTSDSLWMNIKSKSFVFAKERINSRNVMLFINFFGDSIFHTNLSFSYLVNQREVNLFRTDEATSQAPYIDTYHKVSLNFEQIIWKIDEPVMDFSMARGASFGRALFRSQNYFDRRYYERLQYMDAQNPLVTIRQVAARYGASFTAASYANYIKSQIREARVQLITIAQQGFITYDSELDMVTVLPHLYEFLDAAAQKIDFDVIELNSQVSSPTKNSTLDIRTHDLLINGIERFMVSDSQRVIISPKGQQVVMQKNRFMQIDGRVDAGKTEFYGELMRFNYDEFKIELSKVDSLFFHVPTGETDFMGRPVSQRTTTAVKKLIGNIFIDQYDNKSGRKSLKNYPILRTDSLAYVDYDNTDIENRAYKAETFFFEIDPFEMDSLDRITKQSVALKGRFVSGGIFDDMRQTLRVQPDYSLGFVHVADTALSTYKQSDLFAEVRLSNKGLEASGKLEYLTTSIHAEDFKLYPDSMNVLDAKQLTIRKQKTGVEFPDVDTRNSRIHWTPKKETMHIMNKKFDLYDKQVNLNGSLFLRPTGLLGEGHIDMANETADIRSNEFVLKADKFQAEQSDLQLRAVKDGPYRVMTIDSLRSEIDFEKRQGVFIPNNQKNYTLVDFPSNKFAGYIEKMVWDIDDAQLKMVSVDTLATPVEFKYAYPGESKGSRYYSTQKNADSLSFVAPRNTLDLASGIMNAEGVNLVKTFDAIVYPGKGKLTVNTLGELEMDESKVIFNDVLRQHTVYDAKLNIQGRRQFSGAGKYDYIDETGAVSVVDIHKIEADKSGKTVANGLIPEESSFKLSPYFSFQGGMTLTSDTQYPVFDGYGQIVHECNSDALQTQWFKFKSPINPESVYLPVDDAPVNNFGSKIYNGLFVTTDSIYPAIFTVRKTAGDKQILNASGVMTYDKDLMTYFIASPQKLANRDTTGNLLSLDRDKCLVYAEGKLSLGTDFGRVKYEVAGSLLHDINNHETVFNVMMSFDFPFDNGLAGMVATAIETNESLSGVDMQQKTFIIGMNEWLGVRKSETYRRDALLGKVQNFPAELNKTLVLTQLNMYWSSVSRSYRSVGKIGVGNIFGNQVNRLVDGIVEIRKVPSGDLFDIYLKIDDSNWYYFSYTRENLQIISSDNAFNERLTKLPIKQRRFTDRPRLTYMIAATDRLSQFQRQWQQSEFRGAEPPKIMGSSVGSSGSSDSQPSPTPLPPVSAPEANAPIIEVE